MTRDSTSNWYDAQQPLRNQQAPAPRGVEPPATSPPDRDLEAAPGDPACPGRRCAPRMEPKPLDPGDELPCPHCRRWHSVKLLHKQGTDYTVRMLYFECRSGQYYAGQLGTASRHQTRAPWGRSRSCRFSASASCR